MPSDPVLASCGCHSVLHNPSDLKTIETCPLTTRGQKSEAFLPLEARGENPSCLFLRMVAPSVPGLPWPVATPLQPLLPSLHALLCACLLCASLLRMLVIAQEPTQVIQDDV